MKNGLLVGISGKINSGKDEAALMLSYLYHCKCENLEPSFEEYAESISNSYKGVVPSLCRNRIHKFANALKWALASCIGRDRLQFESRKFKNEEIPWLNNLTVRELLQKFATAIRHEVDEDFWVKCLLHKYKDDYIWFISDLRYLNEARAIKSLNGILIRIDRPQISDDNHPSETELDNYPNWDFKINNNGTLEDLFNKCKEIIYNI